MTDHSRRLLFWAPRLLTLAFAVFLSAFALDVFSEKHPLGELLLALLIHLVPAAIILVVLAFAWRWEWIGAMLFAGLGILYCLRNLRHPNWIVVISGPLFLIAGLFLFSWVNRDSQPPSNTSSNRKDPQRSAPAGPSG
jgi:hypothetical protein